MATLPDVALGAIGAAIVAGSITLANLVGGKENKTSEFRQAWIDELRTDVSNFISSARVLDGMIGVKFRDREAIWNASRERAIALFQAASNIRMRLNPTKDSSKVVLGLLGDVERLLAIDANDHKSSPTAPAPQAVAKKAAELISAVNVILKENWEHVKRGKPRYRVAVWGAAILLITSITVLVLTSFAHPVTRQSTLEALPPSMSMTGGKRMAMPQP